MTLKAFKTLGDIVRCLSLSFSLGESLPLKHLLVVPPPHQRRCHSYFTAFLVSGPLGSHLVPADAHLPLGRLYLCRYECVHVRVTPPSGSCLNLKYDMHISGQRILSICSLVLLPPLPLEQRHLEEKEGHFTNKLTGGPSAPGLPGKPGFPVGP